MSQTYKLILDTDLIPDSRITINDNFEALRTSFEGASFPSSPSKGQIAYINDNLYIYDGTAWKKIWYESNDGSGSTLDADTVDSLHASSFVRSDADDTMNGSYTVTGDLIIQGGLTVQGSTTTLDTQQLLVEDNIITLNSNVTGSPTIDAGIEIERGTAANTSIIWDETNDYWKLTEDGTNYKRIYHDSYHPVADKLNTARTISLSGDVSGSTSFDGSSNVSITATVADNSHNHTSANISDATSSNTANMIVKRDASGNFSAGTITATLNGSADKVDGYHASQTKAASTIPVADSSGYINSWVKQGSGSTLDADTVDNLHASSFVRSDADDTISGDITLTGALGYTQTTDVEGVHIIQPQGGIYTCNDYSITGYLKITLPVSWTSSMLRFTIDFYDYAGDTDGESWSMEIGGYNYAPSSSWINCFAVVKTSRTDRFFNVRFGHDGTKCAIYVGESGSTWSYPQIAIRDVLVGYSNANMENWADGWSVGFTTTLGTITKTVTAGLTADYALNADKLDGYHAGNASGNIPISNGTVNTNLNADLLDGYHASSFLQASSYTASDVLTKIKTVDGSGSGLDADTLDGYQPSTSNIANTVVLRDGSGNFSAGTITTKSITPSATTTYDIGTSSTKYNNVYAVTFSGTASTAQYADLAEKYICDESLPIGTLVSVCDSEDEVSITSSELCYTVVGIVSENPAYLMNVESKGLPIALKGKVKVRVVGKVKKGDVLVSSVLPGVARTIKDKSELLYKVAIALESKDTDTEGLIYCIL